MLNPEWVDAPYRVGYFGEVPTPRGFLTPMIYTEKFNPDGWVGEVRFLTDPCGPRFTAEGKPVLPSLVLKV